MIGQKAAEPQRAACGRAYRRSTAAAAAGGIGRPCAARAKGRKGLSLSPQAGARAVRWPSALSLSVACPRAASLRAPRLEPLHLNKPRGPARYTNAGEAFQAAYAAGPSLIVTTSCLPFGVDAAGDGAANEPADVEGGAGLVTT